jgi:hypothetical protein
VAQYHQSLPMLPRPPPLDPAQHASPPQLARATFCTARALADAYFRESYNDKRVERSVMTEQVTDYPTTETVLDASWDVLWTTYCTQS